MTNYSELTKEMIKEIHSDWKQNKHINQRFYEKTEDELQYRILCQRFKNLKEFLKNLQKKYALTESDVNELLELWFLYDDLKEIHFIGTDLYSNAMFVKHTVPCLFRSVGRDQDTEAQEKNRKEIAGPDPEKRDIGNIIMNECLKQIKSGGEGRLYSYSKCFGRMLFKYANIKEGSKGEEVEIECRKNARVNCVCDNLEAGHYESLQRYIHKTKSMNLNSEIPLFCVDMSNARDDSVTNMKTWLNDYLGEQKYIKRNNEIYDPIGDAEVVADFTGENKTMCDEVVRRRIPKDDFCKLLYGYGLELSKQLDQEAEYVRYIKRSIETIPCKHNYYNRFHMFMKTSDVFDEYREVIHWNDEKRYMKRQKKEKGEIIGEVAAVNIFKEGTSEAESNIWKNVVIEAIRGYYSGTDFSHHEQN